MTLNQYSAERRLRILDELRKGLPPAEGEYDEALWREGKVKGDPQMGTTRYEPFSIVFEFIFPDPSTNATVLCVRLTPPERIVFLPVPPWVIESIWQGEIDGTHHFESEAYQVFEEFRKELEPEANRKWFEPRPPIGRE
jgi:hypothetical protein